MHENKSAIYYHEDLNSTEKTWLSFKTSTVCQASVA